MESRGSALSVVGAMLGMMNVEKECGGPRWPRAGAPTFLEASDWGLQRKENDVLDVKNCLQEVIDLSEAAQLTGYSVKRLNDFCHAGKLPCRQTPSGNWLTTRAAAEALARRGKLPPGRRKKGRTCLSSRS